VASIKGKNMVMAKIEDTTEKVMMRNDANSLR
jgi:hypothetical protein